MKKIIIDFITTSSSNIDIFNGADIRIKKQVIGTECSVRLTISDKDWAQCEKFVINYLEIFAKKYNCKIEKYKFYNLQFPIYNPKTFVDNLINAEWENFDKDNVHLILDAFYSKLENECYQCDIHPINNLNVYAEQMFNQILTDDNQREVFYKFVVG